MSTSRGRLAGKVAVVTGAGSRGDGVGNGRAIAVLLAREGARVCLADVDERAADKTLGLIRAEGGEAVAVAGDVTLAADCDRIVAAASSSFGSLSVLVNNVGIIPAAAPVAATDEDAWERVMRVNVTSVVLMCRAALPVLIESGGGSIVNVSSTASLMSSGDTPSYAASKAALNRLTAETAVAYGRHGVRANAIAPGVIATPLLETFAPAGSGARAVLEAAAPLGRAGTPWDVAWAAVYLASDEARFVTGICLPVDGGLAEISPFRAHHDVSAASEATNGAD